MLKSCSASPVKAVMLVGTSASDSPRLRAVTVMVVRSVEPASLGRVVGSRGPAVTQRQQYEKRRAAGDFRYYRSHNVKLPDKSVVRLEKRVEDRGAGARVFPEGVVSQPLEYFHLGVG